MDELVKRLRNRRICIQQLGTLNDYPLLGEAADAIEELSRENESLAKSVNEASEILRSRWIPVTERFPEFGVRVLCKCRANIYEVLTWTADGWEHDPQHVYMSGFVTHWMPLPQPPEEE